MFTRICCNNFSSSYDSLQLIDDDDVQCSDHEYDQCSICNKFTNIDEECPICQKIVDKNKDYVEISTCGHLYCMKCFDNYFACDLKCKNKSFCLGCHEKFKFSDVKWVHNDLSKFFELDKFCSLCNQLIDINMIVKLNCGHNYCLSCFTNHFVKENNALFCCKCSKMWSLDDEIFINKNHVSMRFYYNIKDDKKEELFIHF